jgi:hypothetical protein
MYSVDLKNISTQEAYFDVFVPDAHGREVRDPNLYGWDGFTKEKTGTAQLHECSSLIPWEQTPWSYYISQGCSIIRVNIYRIRFRAGAYTKPMALNKEINDGLERTLKQVWKKLGNSWEISSMKLIYYPDYDRVMYHLSGPSLRMTPLGICFPKTLAYKLRRYVKACFGNLTQDKIGETM